MGTVAPRQYKEITHQQTESKASVCCGLARAYSSAY